jgi:hypothetical protein
MAAGFVGISNRFPRRELHGICILINFHCPPTNNNNNSTGIASRVNNNFTDKLPRAAANLYMYYYCVGSATCVCILICLIISLKRLFIPQMFFKAL